LPEATKRLFKELMKTLSHARLIYRLYRLAEDKACIHLPLNWSQLFHGLKFSQPFTSFGKFCHMTT